MLYILINHDYHLHLIRRHDLAALSAGNGAALIMVPHAISPDLDTSGFAAVHRFDTPLGRSRMPFTLLRYAAQARAVALTLDPGPGDTLLFFSEMEWLNQIVAQHFRRRGAKIVMMDDGGFGTYVSMSLPDSEPLTLQERCIQALYRLLPDLRKSRLFKVSGVLWPRMPDAAIDVIALYHDIPLQRDFPTRTVRMPARKRCDVRPSTVLFMNADMYNDYQDDEAYFAGLRRLMAALRGGFETVYFKFHPREDEVWKRRIREMLAADFPTIEIIDRQGTIEDMILDYRPEVLASYFSTALSSIEYKGIEPLYLYHLLDDLKDQPVFAVVSRILRTWDYHFVESDEDVRSGYRSGIMTSTDTGIELGHLLVPGTPVQRMPA